jgi:hypothetical protein
MTLWCPPRGESVQSKRQLGRGCGNSPSIGEAGCVDKKRLEGANEQKSDLMVSILYSILYCMV